MTRRAFVGLAAGGLVISPASAVVPNPRRRDSATGYDLDVLRSPDLLTAYSGLKIPYPLARSEDLWVNRDICLQTKGSPEAKVEELSIHLFSPRINLTHLHLRWNVKIASSIRILGDAWERSYGDLEWRGFAPERAMPWYFLTVDGDSVHGCGVRTGAGALCFWQVDPDGVSLWADLRNGGSHVELGSRRLHVATVVTHKGEPGEAPFECSRHFCRKMCLEPTLPDGPLYGGNDWNYAYGKNTADGIRRGADLIALLAPRSGYKPIMVIDDGWQDERRFPNMVRLASDIRDRGLRPGLWVRPTRATRETKSSLLLSRARFPQGCTPPALSYDPTIPEALEAMMESVRQPVSWGYDFVKHDYSTYELLGRWGSEMGPSPTREGWSFADRTRTNAEILVSFYQALRRAAGKNTLILGCNTMGHLSAGIFESQRSGDDASGKTWERTRRMAINSLAFRSPQHRTFFHLDPDCVAVTTRTIWSESRQWLDLVSRCGTSLFVSLEPEAIGPEQKAAVKDAFQIVASSTGFAEDWLNDKSPQRWRFQSHEESIKNYRWFGNSGTSPFDV